MLKKVVAAAIVVLVAVLVWRSCASRSRAPLPSKPSMRLATTTSVVDSGLLERLLPEIERNGRGKVEVLSVGSGRALEMLARGEADVAITHAPEAEQAALASGLVARRTPFMRNDFVLVGPPGVAEDIAGAGDVKDALRRIVASGRKFVSRGDGSGTHQREQALWKAAGLEPGPAVLVEAKAGMGATLARASEEGAFTLSDRATFVAKRKKLALAIVFQGDDELINEYSLLEPKDGAKARALADFLRSDAGRSLIGAFGVLEHGEPLFTPTE